MILTHKNSSERELMGQYLTFTLDEQLCGVDVFRISEIIELLPITPLPRSPKHTKGVINLRGKIIPVFDLRLKLNLKETQHNSQSCIIIAQSENKSQSGLLVEKVSDVISLKFSSLKNKSQLPINAKYIFALGDNSLQETVTILNIDEIISTEDHQLATQGVKQ